MKAKIFQKFGLFATLVFLGVSLQGLAQETAPPPLLPPLALPDAGVAVGARMFFFRTGGPAGQVVAGKPYSAEETIGTTQVLADGNRIVHSQSAQVYRDSKGRTRRDETLAIVGPWAVQDKPPEMIEIHDPVAGVRYVLNAEKKTAIKLTPAPPPNGPGAPGPDQIFSMKVGGAASASGGPPRQDMIYVRSKFEGNGPKFPRTTESLGNQIIEGVLAQGTRTTMTIPADAMGNEKPIVVTDERWYAPALQLDVLSKHTDPRFGETDFKLTSIKLAEPDPSLFQVPADYSVTDKPGNTVTFQMRTGGPRP
jgi:hypothetical protein